MPAAVATASHTERRTPSEHVRASQLHRAVAHASDRLTLGHRERSAAKRGRCHENLSSCVRCCRKRPSVSMRGQTPPVCRRPGGRLLGYHPGRTHPGRASPRRCRQRTRVTGTRDNGHPKFALPSSCTRRATRHFSTATTPRSCLLRGHGRQAHASMTSPRRSAPDPFDGANPAMGERSAANPYHARTRSRCCSASRHKA
jgi:hypothetical protein